MQKNTTRKRRSGNALVEVTLMAPWIFFLFVGVLDFGFYSYQFISVENAARAAALLTSHSKAAATDQTDACALVLSELNGASYGKTLSASCNDASNCATKPCLSVAATLVAGPDGADAAQVEVKYTTIGMIPIPGVLASSFVIDRKWQMKINPAADF
jgi:Flp pilus assembly protein TadG